MIGGWPAELERAKDPPRPSRKSTWRGSRAVLDVKGSHGTMPETGEVITSMGTMPTNDDGQRLRPFTQRSLSRPLFFNEGRKISPHSGWVRQRVF